MKAPEAPTRPLERARGVGNSLTPPRCLSIGLPGLHGASIVISGRREQVLKSAADALAADGVTVHWMQVRRLLAVQGCNHCRGSGGQCCAAWRAQAGYRSWARPAAAALTPHMPPRLMARLPVGVSPSLMVHSPAPLPAGRCAQL